jgi:hypothetical protein
MNLSRHLLGAFCAFTAVLTLSPSLHAEGETISAAQQTFQQQIQSSMDQLKKAVEVRDRAVEVINGGTQGVKDAPQQISAMIDAVKELNSGFDEGSQFRSALDGLGAILDQKIAETLADSDQVIREAAEPLKVRRERVSELQKQATELVERGKTLVRKLEDRRRVAEKLIAVENVDTAISVAQEALDQYRTALTAFEGVAERSSNVVAPGS